MPTSRKPKPPPTPPSLGSWMQKNVFHLVTLGAHFSIALVLLGKFYGTIDRLQVDVAEIRANMVNRELLDIQIKELQNAIKEQDLRITALEQRVMDYQSSTTK